MNAFIVLYHFCNSIVYTLSLLNSWIFYKDCFQEFQYLSLLLPLILFITNIEHMPAYLLVATEPAVLRFLNCVCKRWRELHIENG